jgi:hypothetical protein
MRVFTIVGNSLLLIDESQGKWSANCEWRIGISILKFGSGSRDILKRSII